MSYARAEDGTRLYYEEVGSGTSVIFIHEFAGDYRSWEPQMRLFARLFRCIVYSARGFPRRTFPTALHSTRRQSRATTSSLSSTICRLTGPT